MGKLGLWTSERLLGAVSWEQYLGLPGSLNTLLHIKTLKSQGLKEGLGQAMRKFKMRMWMCFL